MDCRWVMAWLATVLVSGATSSGQEEENPFVEAARSLLQDQLAQGGGASGLAALAGLVQNFVQPDDNKGGSPAADILSGIGALLTGQKSRANNAGGGLDPQLIGHMLSMFAGTQANNGDQDSNNNIDVNNNEVRSDGGAKKNAEQPGIDWQSMLELAGSLVASPSQGGGGGKSPLEGIINILPVLMQSMNTPHEHKPQPSFVPPFLGSLWEYWEHFSSSEFGQTLWQNSGLGGIVKLFTDEQGNFQVDRIFGSLENARFRRRWIKSLTTFIAEWVAHVSDPATQTRYIATAQFMGNSFLKAQGYGKAALFDPARPADSLSHLANSVFKRQFGLKVNSATYIKPAVAYIQDLFRLGQSKGLGLSYLSAQDIQSRLAEALNGEIIEPVLRVWRAYRHATHNPECDRYLICVINAPDPATALHANGTGLKPGVTKLSSIVASWFLSGNTGTPFWKLYNAAVEDHNCTTKYPADCSDFHAEDIRATTEYSHSEL